MSDIYGAWTRMFNGRLIAEAYCCKCEWTRVYEKASIRQASSLAGKHYMEVHAK